MEGVEGELWRRAEAGGGRAGCDRCLSAVTQPAGAAAIPDEHHLANLGDNSAARGCSSSRRKVEAVAADPAAGTAVGDLDRQEGFGGPSTLAGRWRRPERAGSQQGGRTARLRGRLWQRGHGPTAAGARSKGKATAF